LVHLYRRPPFDRLTTTTFGHNTHNHFLREADRTLAFSNASQQWTLTKRLDLRGANEGCFQLLHLHPILIIILGRWMPKDSTPILFLGEFLNYLYHVGFARRVDDDRRL
jgi:hypothetical protein